MNAERRAVRKVRKARDRLEIAGDVLLLATARISKSQITIRAKLSYEQANAYLDLLTNRRLIERKVEGGDVFYRVTAQGRQFIDSFDALYALLGQASGVRSSDTDAWRSGA